MLANIVPKVSSTLPTLSALSATSSPFPFATSASRAAPPPISAADFVFVVAPPAGPVGGSGGGGGDGGADIEPSAYHARSQRHGQRESGKATGRNEAVESSPIERALHCSASPRFPSTEG